MVSLAASTAATSSSVKEMLGNPLNVSTAVSSSAPNASNPAVFKIVALFSKKKAAPPRSKTTTVSPINDELAKWYGPDRRVLLPEGLLDRSEVPEYVNGYDPSSFRHPGLRRLFSYGYDSFGLSKKPENFSKHMS